MRTAARLLAPLAALATALAAPAAAERPAQVDLAELIRETQKQSADSSSLELVWWMPIEFWQASMGTELSAEQREQVIGLLRPYLMFAVVDGTIGPLGGVTFSPEPTVRSQIKLFDVKGRSYAPLPEEKISADVKNLFQIMRPMLQNIIGRLGENLHFFVFPAVDETGARIGDPRSEGALEVQLGERRFRWRLPLGSLLAPKLCPEDGEELNGAWTYCPWHGVKLKSEAPAPAAPLPSPPPPKPDPPSP